MSNAWHKVKAVLCSKWARVVELGGLAAFLFLVGAVVGGAIVFTAFKAHPQPDPSPRQVAAFSEVDADQARQLAERFRPWLRFDTDERWRPLNVASFLGERTDGEGAHRFCARTPAPDCTHRVEGEADFTALVHAESSFGTNSYLDIAGRQIDDYHGPGSCRAPLADCGTAPDSAMYFHVMRSNDRYYIDYWWFFRYNNFYRKKLDKTCRFQAAIDADICDEHEGDWEGVTVVTPPGDDDVPDYVVFAAHKGTFRYAASELTLHDKTRPEIFVARGSHASYPRACAEDQCPQPLELAGLGVLTLPEGRFDGEKPWARNGEDCSKDDAHSCLLPLPRVDRDARAWTVWPGQWGAGCEAACHGHVGVRSPQSPGLQPRYQTPWCSTRNAALVCDGRALACSDWLGPLVAVVACTPHGLAEGQRSPEAEDAGTLVVRVAGREMSNETVPGVVQVLGDPLQPGPVLPNGTVARTVVTVSGGTLRSQVLLRAQIGQRSYEARFDQLGLGAGRRVTFTIDRFGREDRRILAHIPGQPRPRAASELRITRLVAGAVTSSGGGA